FAPGGKERGFWACPEKGRDPEAADVQLGRDIALRPAVEVVAASHTGHQHQLRWPGPHVDPSPHATDRSPEQLNCKFGTQPQLLWRAASPFYRQRGSPIRRGTLGDHL